MRQLVWTALYVCLVSLHPSVYGACPQSVLEQWGERADGARELHPSIRQMLPSIAEVFGRELFVVEGHRWRPCGAAGVECAVFSFPESPRSSYDIEIALGGSVPRFERNDAAKRIQITLPRGWRHVASKGSHEDVRFRAWLNRALRSTALHPFDPHSVHPRRSKQVQKEAFEAYRIAMEHGKKSFMVVGPPGVGKTDVLLPILQDRIDKVPQGGKLIIVTTDQIDPVLKFAKAARTRGIEVVEWGGDSVAGEWNALMAQVRASRVPVVLVTTVQSLAARIDPRPGREAIVREYSNVIDSILFDEVQNSGGLERQPLVLNLAAGQHTVIVGATCIPYNVHAHVRIQQIFGTSQYWMYEDDLKGFEERLPLPYQERPFTKVLEQYERAEAVGEIDGVKFAYRLPDSIESSEGPVGVFEKASNGVMDISPRAYRSLALTLRPFLAVHTSVFIRVPSIPTANAMAEFFTNHRGLIETTVPVVAYHSRTDLVSTRAVQKIFEEGQTGIVFVVDRTEAIDWPEASLAVDLTQSTNPRDFVNFMGRVTRIAQGKPSPTMITAGLFEEGTLQERLALATFLEKGILQADNPSALLFVDLPRSGPNRDIQLPTLARLSDALRSRLARELELEEAALWRQSLPDDLQSQVTADYLRQMSALRDYLVALDAALWDRMEDVLANDPARFVLKGVAERMRARDGNGGSVLWLPSALVALKSKLTRRVPADPFQEATRMVFGEDSTYRLLIEDLRFASLAELQRRFPNLPERIQRVLGVLWTEARFFEGTKVTFRKQASLGMALLSPQLKDLLQWHLLDTRMVQYHLRRFAKGPDTASPGTSLEFNRSKVFLESDLGQRIGGYKGGPLVSDVTDRLPISVYREVERIKRQAWFLSLGETIEREMAWSKEFGWKRHHPRKIPREIEVLLPELSRVLGIRLENGLDQDAWTNLKGHLLPNAHELILEWHQSFIDRTRGTVRREQRVHLSAELANGFSALKRTFERTRFAWHDQTVPGWNMEELVAYYRTHRRLPEIWLDAAPGFMAEGQLDRIWNMVHNLASQD